MLANCFIYLRAHSAEQADVAVSWDGRRIVAPPGVVNEVGFVDLTPFLRPRN